MCLSTIAPLSPTIALEFERERFDEKLIAELEAMVLDYGQAIKDLARSKEEEFADQPWYPNERGDVFPEYFPRFIDLSPGHRELFAKSHSELFDHGWWRALQDRLRRDPAGDVQPYPESARIGFST